MSFLVLSNNPVAEETNYRFRVIAAIPSLKFLDRHEISIIERIRAEKLFTQTGEEKVKIQIGKKKQKESIKKMRPETFNLSVGERDLAKEVFQLKQKQMTEKERVKFPEPRYTTAPLCKTVLTNREKFTFDKDKSGYITDDEIMKVFNELKQDVCSIGKIPDCDEQQFKECLAKLPRGQKTQKINWIHFRNGMNNFPWKSVEEDQLKQNISTFYSQAQRQEISGKRNEAQKEIIKALKLEQILEKSKRAVSQRELVRAEPKFKRGDVFTRTFLAKTNIIHGPGTFRSLFNKTPLMEVSMKKVALPFI